MLQAFLCERLTHLVNKVSVPRTGSSNRSRETGRRIAVADSDFLVLCVLFSQTVRSVTDHYFRESESLDAFEMPEILARAKRRFFLKRHL